MKRRRKEGGGKRGGMGREKIMKGKERERERERKRWGKEKTVMSQISSGWL